MNILKILADPFVVVLTLLVTIVSFFYYVASWLCHIGCEVLHLLALVLFIGGQILGGNSALYQFLASWAVSDRNGSKTQI